MLLPSLSLLVLASLMWAEGERARRIGGPKPAGTCERGDGSDDGRELGEPPSGGEPATNNQPVFGRPVVEAGG